MADENVTTEVSGAEGAAPAPAPAKADRANESIGDAMERLGWDKEVPHTENPDALGSKARAAEAKAAAAKSESEPEEEPTKPEVPKPKTPEPAQANDKRAQLEALVAELGLQLEDSRVMPAERVALRAERREAQAKIEKLEREAMERIEKSTKALEERTPKLAKLDEFEAAIASGDHEAVAKFMGFESYDKWQEHIIALKSDPAYVRLRALEQKAAEAERKAKEREEAAQREASEREQREQTEQRNRAQAEARATYLRDLAATMAKSSDPLVKAMADDPGFVGAIFRVQQDHWDGRSQPMSIEQAIRTPAKGVSQPLMAEMERLYKKLAPIFGQPQPNASTAVAAVKAGVGKPAPSETTEPSKKAPRTPQPNKAGALVSKRESEQDWKRRAAAQMEAAAREDRARTARKPNGAATG